MKAQGRIIYEPTSPPQLRIECEPHVMIRLKAVFPNINHREFGSVRLAMRDEICRDLEWFAERYPIDMDATTRAMLLERSQAYRKNLESLERITLPEWTPMEFPGMALPPRRYQSQAVEIFLRSEALLVSDQMGLGKTVTAIAAFADARTLPALVVCAPHLCKQWQRDFLAKFLPGARVHIIKTGKYYELPKADVYVISYHKMANWAEVFSKGFFKTIVFDEVQELRHEGSQKYNAARAIRKSCAYAMGLSGTPIYNYGGEIFNIVDLLAPRRIGTRDEFEREWCTHSNGKLILKEPNAFGQYLRSEFLMVRRSRADVGLELPKAQKIVQEIPFDPHVLDRIKDHATELAKLILHGSFTESGQAAREFDLKMRQQTGIAKAPFTAEFVKMLVEEGEKVLLFGWHREVYTVWQSVLEKYRPVMFTGTETQSEKDRARTEFMKPEGSPVMIMSLRSGAGVDGLQAACKTVVFGELDWSPGVHEQCEARINRDGVGAGVQSYYLVADGGSDPLMAEVLGLKTAQVQGLLGVVNQDDEGMGSIETDRIKQMARTYLGKK